MKSLAVIVFIAAVAGVALFCAQQRTVARGEALGASLLESNPNLKAMACDDRVPIGIDGATFNCKVTFKNGDVADYKFKLNREGDIVAVDHGGLKKTADPWQE